MSTIDATTISAGATRHATTSATATTAAARRPARPGVVSRALGTEAAAAPLLLRIALGAIMFPHGAQHALGWFGGYGFGGTLGWMTGTVGIPAPLAVLAIITELVAPLLLVAGLGGRLAAAGIAGIMLGAIPTHWDSGFFMNWFGTMPAGAEGFEFHLLALAMAVSLVITGSGRWSLDRLVLRRLRG